MADNKIQIKRTSVSGRAPNTTNSGNTQFIDTGELAFNLTDRKLFSSTGSALFEVGANLTSLQVQSITANGATGSNGQVLASNGSGVYWASLDSVSKGDKGEVGEKGDKGDTGSKGDKGEVGSKGDKGEVGEKGQKGERTSSASYSDGNNTVVFTNSDTSTYSITGIKGQKGEVGSKGDKGEIGTPGGSNTTVLFNDSGNSNGVIELTFNKDTDTLHIGNNTVNTTINATHVSVKSIFANSSNGSSGQALFSNGTGIYWANIVGGATLVANSTDTQEFYIPMANSTTGSWTNGVVDTVLTFVPSSDRLSLGNTTVNTQVNTTSIRTTSFIDNNGNKLIIRDSSNNIVWGG